MLREIAGLVPILRPVLTGTVLLFAWLSLLVLILGLLQRVWCWLRQRKLDEASTLQVAAGAHWLILAVAALLYVLR